MIDTSISGFDGVTTDCQGRVYVTSWGSCGPALGGCLLHFDPPLGNLSTPTIIASGMLGPSDIAYNRRTGEIAVPELGTNTVTFHPVEGCEASLFIDDFEP